MYVELFSLTVVYIVVVVVLVVRMRLPDYHLLIITCNIIEFVVINVTVCI